LSKVDAENSLISNEAFYVRTAAPPLPEGEWEVKLGGLVEEEVSFSMSSLQPEDQGELCMECSGNNATGGYGLISTARFGGVPLEKILEKAKKKPEATMLLVEGLDYAEDAEPSKAGCSWVFQPDDLKGAFLCTTMNGKPLPKDHGAPVRLLIPNHFGCCQPKWVTSIRWVGNEEPATSQMKEFATKTHQKKAFELAREYAPALIQPCAMATRVERWKVNGKEVFRVLGVLWGGPKPVTQLLLSAGKQEAVRVDLIPGNVNSWRFWSVCLEDPPKGKVKLALQVVDKGVPSRRLKKGWYQRKVDFYASL
jgi:DMSO/TMAO reductase YedYZ molybdopterin-dependent catalytic subunit